MQSQPSLQTAEDSLSIARLNKKLSDIDPLFDTLFANSASGMALVDTTGSWLKVNPALCQLLGYSELELLRKRFQDVTHPEDNAQEEAQLPLMTKQASENFQREKRYIHKNGTIIWALLSVSNVYDEHGNVAFFINQIFDISPRKQVELDLLEAKLAAEQANKAKSGFLSRMSHELRTPLNAILGFSELLLLSTQDSQNMYSKQIHNAGEHLLSLINEVLDIARIESGRMSLSLETVDLRQIIKECSQLMHPLAAKHSVELKQLAEGAPLLVKADRQKLKQIILNLLSNAVKYNVKNGTVEIIVKEEQGRIICTVKDTGVGISEDNHEDVFIPFNRIDADESDIEGTGIGLTISQKLAECMNGSLTLNSTLGKGSSFHLSLKAAQKESKPELTQLDNWKSPLIQDRSLSILYVEDNPSNQILMQSIIDKTANMTLSISSNGQEALEYLGENPAPDLILLDLHMPKLSGDAVLEELKESKTFSSIPVVMVSADATPSQIKALLAKGAAKYITKPIEIRVLMQTMQDILI